jgi:hypothetical protein
LEFASNMLSCLCIARMLERTKDRQAIMLNTRSSRWRSTDLHSNTKATKGALGFGLGVSLSFH